MKAELEQSPLKIRPLAPEDAEAASAVFWRAVRIGARRAYSEAQVRAWAEEDLDPAAWLADREGVMTWVAERDWRIVGFASLTPLGVVDMLYVDPEHEREGVAGALLSIVRAHAQSLGLPFMTTEASICARPVFERFGFEVVAEQEVEHNGELFLNYRMVRPLVPTAAAGPVR